MAHAGVQIPVRQGASQYFRPPTIPIGEACRYRGWRPLCFSVIWRATTQGRPYGFRYMIARVTHAAHGENRSPFSNSSPSPQKRLDKSRAFIFLIRLIKPAQQSAKAIHDLPRGLGQMTEGKREPHTVILDLTYFPEGQQLHLVHAGMRLCQTPQR